MYIAYKKFITNCFYSLDYEAYSELMWIFDNVDITLHLLIVLCPFTTTKRAGENQYSYDICMLEVLIDMLNFVGNKIGLQVVVILQILFLFALIEFSISLMNALALNK